MAWNIRHKILKCRKKVWSTLPDIGTTKNDFNRSPHAQEIRPKSTNGISWNWEFIQQRKQTVTWWGSLQKWEKILVICISDRVLKGGNRKNTKKKVLNKNQGKIKTKTKNIKS